MAALRRHTKFQSHSNSFGRQRNFINHNNQEQSNNEKHAQKEQDKRQIIQEANQKLKQQLQQQQKQEQLHDESVTVLNESDESSLIASMFGVSQFGKATKKVETVEEMAKKHEKRTESQSKPVEQQQTDTSDQKHAEKPDSTSLDVHNLSTSPRLSSTSSSTLSTSLLSSYSIPHRYECELKGHSKSVSALSIDRSGARIISGGYDYQVKMWGKHTTT